jgi:hypothetical protein
VVNRENPWFTRMKDQRGARDVSRPVLARRKWLRAVLQKKKHEVFAFGCKAVIARIETGHQPHHIFFRKDHVVVSAG